MYIKLWLKVFLSLCKLEGFKAAMYIMLIGRKERSIKELLELNDLLKNVQK